MKYVKYNMMTELKKAAAGKKTKMPVEILLLTATAGLPHAQKLIARAFRIKHHS